MKFTEAIEELADAIFKLKNEDKIFHKIADLGKWDSD